jgi:regulator of protease activity HflC (stomatin/prohibitin superfamily)
MKAYLFSLDGKPPPTTKHSMWRRFVERRLPSIVIYLMVATLVAVVLYPHVVVTVPSGEVGVLWRRFGNGTVLDPRQLKDEGIHFLLPWNELFLYDLRIQSLTETYNAISSDGVSLTATINIRFRLKRDAIPTLHQVIGPNYTKLLGPEIASQMREVIAQFTAEQVYSTARQEIQEKIRERTVERLGSKMMEREGEESYNVAMRDTIILYDTLLYGIELPALVVTAINRKTEQYYIAEEYKFRVEREKRESERKKIEAEGIREFQQIVSQGISDSYLRWRGIEATLQLSQSTNSKVVVIGNAKDGLPIILGNADAVVPPPNAAETPPARGDTAPKDRTTMAPGPAMPLERTPAAGLTTPMDAAPAAGSARQSAASSSAVAPPAAAPSAAASQEPRSLWPPSLSEIDAYLSRMIRPREEPKTEPKPGPKTELKTEPAARQPSDRRASEQSR